MIHDAEQYVPTVFKVKAEILEKKDGKITQTEFVPETSIPITVDTSLNSYKVNEDKVERVTLRGSSAKDIARVTGLFDEDIIEIQNFLKQSSSGIGWAKLKKHFTEKAYPEVYAAIGTLEKLKIEIN